ncbi:MAG: DUF4384 domain-containing protein [Desulfomonile tiedjei]|uniref:DUF4384 domain-containing protein n=1 Tax=Desulfomonile tiedjei TaxID=2358 RepID=A0A9D6V2Y1_9BACT|nr:DUF4384 domain-containing protein [Desulfomonile tiedjei]
MNDPWRTASAWTVLGAGFLILAFVVVCAAGPCENETDWRNIGLLPSNGNYETNIKIQLFVDKTLVYPGDTVTVRFKADKDGYVTLINQGTSGKIIRLWPNEYSGMDNFVRADTERSFPAPTDQFDYVVNGPGGVERIVAYAVSQKDGVLKEDDFKRLTKDVFKEFKGTDFGLDDAFRKQISSLPADTKWGTAQLNLCIQDRQQVQIAAPSSVQVPATPAANQGEAPSEPAEKTYILAIGVYYPDLRWTFKDAEDFVKATKTKLRIPNSQIKTVMGKAATYQGFVGGMKWLESVTRPQDSVIIYYSGHGSSIKDQPPLDEDDGKDECYVLYPAGGSMTSQQAIQNKVLMVDDEFNVLLKAIPSRKKIVVVDSCHSGTIHKVIGQEDHGTRARFFPFTDVHPMHAQGQPKSKAKPPNQGSDNEAILAACLDSENSQENPELENGLFTHFLIKAINGGVSDLDEAFKVSKKALDQYIASRRNQGVEKQNPRITDPLGIAKTMKFNR